MKTITKKLSLEPLKTRYTVCYPSIKDGVITYLLPENLETSPNAFYNCIPLGVSEAITGSYSDFTQEMYDAYHHDVVFCHTLQKWMNEFRQYYGLIRSNECHGVFESAVDYYTRTYPYGSDITEAEALDENFKKHGGEKFYNWLIDNYFIILDFQREYEFVEDVYSYDMWLDVINNIGSSYMTYQQVLTFFGKMSEFRSKYDGADCSKEENCCDCVDYKLFGGDYMYDFLQHWIERINSNITSNNSKVSTLYSTPQYAKSRVYNYENICMYGNEVYIMIYDGVYVYNEFLEEKDGIKYWKPYGLIPKTCINAYLESKIEDLGVLVSFSKEFIPFYEYKQGNVCTSDDEVYVMIYADGTYSKEYFVTEENGITYWKKYYDVYIEEHEDEKDIDYNDLPPLTGRTVSSLDSFMRKEDTVDIMGNSMPGYFRPNTSSYFVQPAENTLLDFMYQPGTYNNVEKFMMFGPLQLYTCDFLQSIEFFYMDLDENIIDETRVVCEIGNNVNSKIEECIDNAILMEESRPNTGIIYADCLYYKQSVVAISETGMINRIFGGDIKFIDHCTVELATCQYHISQTESYPLRYYKLNMDIEEHFSDEYQRYVNVCMCDFIFNQSEIGPKKHSASPLFRKEELLPYVSTETPVDNIYIDRGYATVLDRHLRVGEVRNYEQLEKYGNGIFQIFNSSEEVV